MTATRTIAGRLVTVNYFLAIGHVRCGVKGGVQGSVRVEPCEVHSWCAVHVEKVPNNQEFAVRLYLIKYQPAPIECYTGPVQIQASILSKFR